MTCRDIHLHRVCEMSPAHPEFRVIMVPGRDGPKVEKRFIILFPLNYTTRRLGEPPERCWHLM